MDDVVFVANVIIGALTLAAGGFAVAWLRARERAIRAELTRPPASDADAKLDRLQQAVDAMAVEVERISEAQRFTARVLGERSPVERSLAERAPAEAPSRVPGRVVTPH